LEFHVSIPRRERRSSEPESFSLPITSTSIRPMWGSPNVLPRPSAFPAVGCPS
jgi:hypothetical protein